MKRVAELVRPGGYIVMTTPNGGYFRNNLPRFSDCSDPSIFESSQFGPNSEDHIFLLHVDEVTTLAKKAGLSVDRLLLFNNPLTAGHIRLAPLLKIVPRRIIDAVETVTTKLPAGLRRKTLSHMAVRLSVSSA